MRKPRNNKPFPARGQRGFTLIEVMVSLTIFAFCAVSMNYVLTQSVDNFRRMERNTLASWIAENEITELRLRPNYPGAGQQRKRLEYAGRDWELVTQVSNTEDPRMRRVEVSVYLSEQGASEPSLVTSLTGFLGRD